MLFHRSPFFHGMRLQRDRCDPCFAFAFVGVQQLCHFDLFFSKHWFTGNTISLKNSKHPPCKNILDLIDDRSIEHSLGWWQLRLLVHVSFRSWWLRSCQSHNYEWAQLVDDTFWIPCYMFPHLSHQICIPSTLKPGGSNSWLWQLSPTLSYRTLVVSSWCQRWWWCGWGQPRKEGASSTVLFFAATLGMVSSGSLHDSCPVILLLGVFHWVVFCFFIIVVNKCEPRSKAI